MATLKQYYETDFSHALKMSVILHYAGDDIEGAVVYDVAAYAAFVTWYIPGTGRTPDYFAGFLKELCYGSTKLSLAKIVLPSSKQFPGDLRSRNAEAIEVEYRFFGDPVWQSAQQIPATTRVFIYAETAMSSADITELQRVARDFGHELQFRDAGYVQGRTRFEKPLAFISHDSRDKDRVARPIAITLQRMLCPVWHDEFSLNVGDHLRESIEKGLRECRKCVLILSSNFFANSGWTKKEFDSIFTRELVKDERVVLPVWCDVTRELVYEYSPSLADVKDLDWGTLGGEEVCRRLHRAIVG